jgi:beta-barrel assembly-enhancing protease
MRLLRELVQLLAIYAAVALVVFFAWKHYPRATKSDTKSANEDSSLSERAEGKMREILLREMSLESNQEPAVKEGIRKIADRIKPAIGELKFPLEIQVIDSATVNAACLPGNIILLYTGLIRRMESPEELAAIVAHEASHAMHRDSMQALKRELGLTALFTLSGGRGDALTGKILRRLISTGFSRQQEQAADDEATRILGDSDIDPKALADGLGRLSQGQGDDSTALQYLSTHPGLAERMVTAEKASLDWKGKARPIDVDWKKFRAQFRMIK